MSVKEMLCVSEEFRRSPDERCKASLSHVSFCQFSQSQLNFAYASFRYRQSPNEKKQTNFCLHASMTQRLPVLFALLVAS